jgi:hypothetical protein
MSSESSTRTTKISSLLGATLVVPSGFSSSSTSSQLQHWFYLVMFVPLPTK